MIRIKLLRNKEKKIISFSCSGHSFYKKRGEDIICAGVSAILQTALLGLSEYLNLKLDVKKKDGFLEVKLCSPPPKEALSILETMRLGIYGICEKYPGYIKIVEKRKKGLLAKNCLQI
ncbi:MAG: ribosomal-processing cysteine protease Prp [bacterium]